MKRRGDFPLTTILQMHGSNGHREFWETSAFGNGQMHALSPLYGGSLHVPDSAFTADNHPITMGMDTAQMSSALSPSSKQVFWLLAPNAAKVNWLQAARSRSEGPYEGYNMEWPYQSEEEAAEACRELPASQRTPECHRNYVASS